MVATIAIVVIVALRNIAVVASLTNFALLATFIVINGAVVVLRFQEPDTDRPFKIPGSIGRLPILPVVGGISSLFMLPFVGWTAIIVGSALAIVGLIFFFVWKRLSMGQDRRDDERQDDQ